MRLLTRVHHWRDGFALATANVCGLAVGQRWDQWAHLEHPFAAQIPVSLLITLALFMPWWRIQRRSLVVSTSGPGTAFLRPVFAVSLAFGPPLFMVLDHRLFCNGLSLGRGATTLVFQLIVNPVVLVSMVAFDELFPGRLVPNLLRRPWFIKSAVMLVSLFVGLCAIAALEVACYFLSQKRPKGPNKEYIGNYLSPAFFRNNSLLGSRPDPNQVVPCRLTIDGKQVWDVNYTIDEYSRRSTPQAPPTGPHEFSAFFGCSFLFGEGCSDAETIPAVYAKEHPEYHSLNYGFPGYGPQQMLARLQSGAFKREVSEDKGLCIYLYLEDVHETRAIGDMNAANGWAKDFPCYQLERDGSLGHPGTFTTGRPLLSKLYHFLGLSQTARYFQLNFPKTLEDEHYALTARIIEESRNVFLQQFPDSHFYVAMYPCKNPHRRIAPFLVKAGITCFDYATLFDPGALQYSFQGDGHPTPQAQASVAFKLSQDIPATGTER